MFFILAKVGFFFLRPLNVLIAVLVVAGLARALGFRRLATSLAVLSGLGLVVVGFSPLGYVALAALEDRFPRPPADAAPPTGIIVLGGAIDLPVSRSRGLNAVNGAADRMTETATLARRFPDARIVFTGGVGNLFGDRSLTEADIAKSLFTDFGIPPERVLYENDARDTFENAVFTQRLVSPKPGERWLIVTSAFHMPRAVATFRAAGFDGIVAYPVDYRITGGDERLWPEASATLNALNLEIAIREFVGLAAYRFAGRSDALFPSP
jgi:uncharacterized SAM-binding protein YcdF (DUF218 family)